MTRVQSWHEAPRNVFLPQCLSGADKQPCLIPLSLLVWGFSTSWILGTLHVWFWTFTGLLLKSSSADGKWGEATLCGETLTDFEMLIKIQWTRQAWTVPPPPPPLPTALDHPGSDLVPHHCGHQLQGAEEDPRQVPPGDLWELAGTGVQTAWLWLQRRLLTRGTLHHSILHTTQ